MRQEVGGTPGGNRTPDTQFRKLVLYPLSYGRTGIAGSRVYDRRTPAAGGWLRP